MLFEKVRSQWKRQDCNCIAIYVVADMQGVDGWLLFYTGWLDRAALKRVASV